MRQSTAAHFELGVEGSKGTPIRRPMIKPDSTAWCMARQCGKNTSGKRADWLRHPAQPSDQNKFEKLILKAGSGRCFSFSCSCLFQMGGLSLLHSQAALFLRRIPRWSIPRNLVPSYASVPSPGLTDPCHAQVPQCGGGRTGANGHGRSQRGAGVVR